MIAFRSVLVPIVAAVMNLLAVGASFGLVVAVFQWGWGTSLLGAGTGPVESFLPIIMIAILFGLSMDYQVVLGLANARGVAQHQGQRGGHHPWAGQHWTSDQRPPRSS